MSVLRVCAFVGIAAAALWGQRQTASVSGIVTDASDAPVAGADIVVKSLSTGMQRAVLSSDSGYYAVTALPAGP